MIQSETIRYEVGETYVFTVHTLHDDLCDLVDPTGLHVYLKHTAGLNLTRGQDLRCRVVALGQYRPKVELDEEEVRAAKDSRVTADAVEALLGTVRGEWDGDGFASLLLMSEMEDCTFAASCREWIERLLGSNVDLVAVCQAVTCFMEETDFLGLCNVQERDTYQQRLTAAIDILDSYVRARALLDDGSAPQFVDHLLDKLDKTGYVYQPDANFRILSSLFLSDRSLVENSIGRLFDVVRRWPLAIWTKAPFNDALLRTLELYIDGNIDRVDRGADNGRLVRNLMQALSILLLLAAQASDTTTRVPDERIILSRLCVISTYIDNYNNKGLLNVATQSLLGTSYYHPQYTLSETAGDHVAYALKRSPASVSTWTVDADSCFLDGHVSLRVGAGGIRLATDDPKAKTVLPDQLGLWGRLQVVADRRAMPSLSGDITVKDSKHLWEAIEYDFTAANASCHALRPTRAQVVDTKNLYGVGDTVTVNVLRVEEDDVDDILYCAFEGDSRECGYLPLCDAVPYLHHVPMWVFLDERSRPLPLKVAIVDRDADDQFRFSLVGLLKDFVCSNYNPGDNVVCSLGVMCPADSTKPFVPGISEYGESVSLRGSLDEDLQRGDLVNAIYLGKAEGTFQIVCQIVSRAEGEVADPVRRFHDLLLDYGSPDEEPTAPPEPQSADTDMEADTRLLDAAYVKELVRILDRMAAIDADYVRAYNYIAFARVLCQMLPDGKARADYYRGRKQLIEMLYNFAVNDTVDPAQLDRLQNEEGEFFADDTPLRDKLQQLRIISYMDRQTHDDELQRLRSVTQGLTREMASLAMAYNILRESNMEQQANDIRNRIKNVLRLNGYESHLKTYGGGIESQTVEFKTSIVYPPNNNSFPDMNRQMKTILTVIAAFLNADGGTLYIGANDSGAGVGVYDDLCYEEFHGDKDKYQRAVLDGVALTWGNNVASYVGVCWDTDSTSGKDVLVATVTPYAPGVEFDGTWVYRNGSGNRHLTKAEFEQYNARRQARQTDPQAVGKPQSVSSDSTAAPATVPPVSPAHPSDWRPCLQTSCCRRNALAYYEEGYLPYEVLLKFMSDGKFCKIPDFDYDYNAELTLPVYEEDLRDHYLLLGYEDNTVGKVPIRELMKFEDYKTYARYDGARLIFAAIAGNADGLVSVTRESKSGERVMVRVDTIGRIGECRLANRGMRLTNEGLAACALGYEIVSAVTIAQAKNVLDRDARTLGQPVATMSDELRRVVPLPKL